MTPALSRSVCTLPGTSAARHSAASGWALASADFGATWNCQPCSSDCVLCCAAAAGAARRRHTAQADQEGNVALLCMKSSDVVVSFRSGILLPVHPFVHGEKVAAAG